MISTGPATDDYQIRGMSLFFLWEPRGTEETGDFQVKVIDLPIYGRLFYGNGCQSREKRIANAARAAPMAVKNTLSSVVSCLVIR